MIPVKPFITLGAAKTDPRIACRATAIGTEPVAVNDIRVKWGREGYFDACDPAELTVHLWDSTGVWARRIRDNTALGQEISLWMLFPPSVIGTTPVTERRQFYGHVTGVTATRLTRTDDDHRTIWDVELTAHDPIAATGNVFPLPGVLKDGERMDTRRKWLEGLVRDYGGLKINAVTYQTAYLNAACRSLEVGRDSARDCLDAFYNSMSADAYTYDPSAMTITQCLRHDAAVPTYMATFGNDVGAVLVSAGPYTEANRDRVGIAIPGGDIDVGEDGVTVVADPDNYINRVETTYATRDTDDLSKTVDQTMWRENILPGQPRRVISNESWFWDDLSLPAIDPARGLLDLQNRSLFDRAQLEGSRPRHPRLVWHAGPEFTDIHTALWWLTCFEDARPGFINGDEAHRWLQDGASDWMPLVSPLGGEVTYHPDTGWDFDLAVQWMHNRAPVTQPPAWVQLQQVQRSSQASSVPWWWSAIGLPVPPPVPVNTPTPARDVKWGPPDPASGQFRWGTSVFWSDLKWVDRNYTDINEIGVS